MASHAKRSEIDKAALAVAMWNYRHYKVGFSQVCDIFQRTPLTPQDEERLLADDNWKVLQALAGHPQLSKKGIAVLAQHPTGYVRREIAARNPRLGGLTPEIKLALARDPEPMVRRALASDGDVNGETLLVLAHDKEDSVKGALMERAGLPTPVWRVLAKDPNPRIRLLPLATLTALKTLPAEMGFALFPGANPRHWAESFNKTLSQEILNGNGVLDEARVRTHAGDVLLKEVCAWKRKDGIRWLVMGRTEAGAKYSWLELPTNVDSMFRLVLRGDQVLAQGLVKMGGRFGFWERTGRALNRLPRASGIETFLPHYTEGAKSLEGKTRRGKLSGVALTREGACSLWKSQEGENLGWVEEDTAEVGPRRKLTRADLIPTQYEWGIMELTSLVQEGIRGALKL